MIKINKMVKEHSVDHHPSPSGLTSTDTPSHISIEPLGFYLSPEHLLNFRCISHNGWGFLQIYGVQITGKCICESENWI